MDKYSAGITICIPAYNEEATIAQVIKDASSVLERTAMPGEILVIDDCSVDETWNILCDMQKTLPALQIRRHRVNQGIARTFAELYQWASKTLVFLNSADGQWKMDTLLDLLPMTGEYDLIVAQRRHKHYGVSRLLVSWLFNALPVIFFAAPTHDAGSVKLARREIYEIPLTAQASLPKRNALFEPGAEDSASASVWSIIFRVAPAKRREPSCLW